MPSDYEGLPLSLGVLLRQHRNNAELSLNNAAKVLSVSAAELARVEAGKLLPTQSLIEAASEAFGLELKERRRLARIRFVAAQEYPAMRSNVDVAANDSVVSVDTSVFLCHSSGDKEQVRKLYRRLVSDGVRCWFDEESLLPGQDWDYEIRKAMRESRYVLACVSSASTTKAGYLQKELKLALDLAEEQPEGRGFILPIRLEDCELPERLRRWQRVDLFRDGGYERLLQGLGVVRTSPPPRPGPAISSNDFNVEVVTAVRELLFDCFGEHFEWIHELSRPDGGVDCLTWPRGEPARRIAIKTFPSPILKLTAAAAREALDGVDIPCLMITRLPLHHGTPVAVSKGHPYTLRFMHWADGSHEEDLEIALRILRDAIPAKAHDAHVLNYIRYAHNRVPQLAYAAVGDQIEMIRTEDKVDATDFVNIMAPTQRRNAEFALKVVWDQDDRLLLPQIRAAKRWMLDHGMPGIIVARGHLTQDAINELNFDRNDRHIQLLLWRDERDDEAMKLCLRRIAGE